MSKSRLEYQARINRAMDYIQNNLDKPLTLEEIARVAAFSPFHFHRIFKALVGEPLNVFIQRLRLERAATQLLGNPHKSITEIALDHGFSGSATFARAFRKSFGMSATAWREGGAKRYSKTGKPNRKMSQTDRNTGKANQVPVSYVEDVKSQNETLNDRRTPMNTSIVKPDVTVKTFPDMTVAYVRHIGPYAGDEALFTGLFEKLMKWAGPRGLLQEETKVMIVYHDNPELTDSNKLRTSVCITVPEGTETSGDIGKTTISKGTYACGHFELAADEYQQAWDAMCGVWLPDSGYQPDDRPPFELCLNDPGEHPEHKHIVDICLPVIPL